LTSKNGVGIRVSLQREYDYIYIYDLKGNVRNGLRNTEVRKLEGENVFGSQTQVGVCVIFLIKKFQSKNKEAKIYYAEIGGGLKMKEKLYKLKNIIHKQDKNIAWTEIMPNMTG
jgi:predicted helicase